MKNNENRCKVIIPHCNGNVKPELERKFEVIFSLSKFQAYNLITKVDAIQLIPGTDLVSVEDAARFFGVQYNYLFTKLRENGFTSELMPTDVSVWSGAKLSNHLKSIGYTCTSCDKELYTVCNGNPDNCKGIRLIKKSRVKMISPRAMLAISLRLATAYNGNSGRSGDVIKVMEEEGLFKDFVEESDGVVEAVVEPTAIHSQETGLTEKEPIEVIHADTEASKANTEHIESNRRQTIEMTPDMFQFVVRSIATEAVRAAMLELKYNH